MVRGLGRCRVMRGVWIYIQGGYISMRVVNSRGEIGMWWIKVYSVGADKIGTYSYDIYGDYLRGLGYATQDDDTLVMSVGFFHR